MKRYYSIFEKIQSIRKISVYSLLVFIVVVATPSSTFASSIFTSHSISSGYTNPYAVVSAAGSLWYLESDSGGQLDSIGNMTNSGTIIANYNIRALAAQPNLTISPTGMVAGADGNLWFSGALSTSYGGGSYAGVLNTTSGAVSIYTNSVIAGSSGYGLIVGPGGYLYYNTYSYNTNYAYLIQVDPTTGTSTIAHTFTTGLTNVAGLASVGGMVWASYSDHNFIEPIVGSGGSIAYLPTGDTSPAALTAGPDGNLWLTASSSSGPKLLKLTPSGTFTEYVNSGVSGLSTGPDGVLWGNGSAGKIARISTSGGITMYTVPGAGVSINSGMALGPDGALWFAYADSSGAKLGSVIVSPDFTNHSISSSYSSPRTVVSTAGSLWYLEADSTGQYYTIGNMNTTGVAVNDYNVRTLSGRPNLTISSAGMTVGPDNNIWFTGALSNSYGGGSYAGVLNSSTGAVNIYTNTVIASSPGYGITVNSDGYLYYCAYSNNTNYAYLVRVDPASRTSTIAHTFSTGSTNVAGLASAGGVVWASYFNHNFIEAVAGSGSGSVSMASLPAGDTNPSSLVAGPDGNLWLLASNSTGSRILKLTPGGTFTEYAIVGVSGLSSGSDGALWGTGGSGSVTRISTSGNISTYTVPGTGVAVNTGMVAGSDGALWFGYSDSGGSKIGRASY